MAPASADSLNIVMAASEAVPYAKTGGLADVVGALAIELTKSGHHVTLLMPSYRGRVIGGVSSTGHATFDSGGGESL